MCVLVDDSSHSNYHRYTLVWDNSLWCPDSYALENFECMNPSQSTFQTWIHMPVALCLVASSGTGLKIDCMILHLDSHHPEATPRTKVHSPKTEARRRYPCHELRELFLLPLVACCSSIVISRLFRYRHDFWRPEYYTAVVQTHQ